MALARRGTAWHGTAWRGVHQTRSLALTASSLPSFAAGGESAPVHHGTGWTSPSVPTGAATRHGSHPAPRRGGDGSGDPKRGGWRRRVCWAAGKESAPAQRAPTHQRNTSPVFGVPLAPETPPEFIWHRPKGRRRSPARTGAARGPDPRMEEPLADTKPRLVMVSGGCSKHRTMAGVWAAARWAPLGRGAGKTN